jgi:chromosome segregation protein
VRIERLDLERYGIFTDRSLTFRPDASLHVVLGRNEGGKTSALSAIGDLLFGFGARTPYDFRHDSNKLRLGGAFRHSDGRLIEARRRKGNKNTLIGADEQALPDDTLAPLLGGLSRENFGREFGLTAQALRDGGEDLLNAGGRLAETLAASSAGMTALSHLREKLQGEADDLFTSRKSAGKPFYVAADRRDSADKALRDAIVTREAVRDLEAAVQAARENLETLNAEHGRSSGVLAGWQRTLRVRTKLARLESIAAELAGFSDLPMVQPPSLAAWREALEIDAALLREVAAIDSTDAIEGAEIAALAVDDGVLAEAAAIDALRERLGAVRKAVDDLPRRRQARDDAERQLDDLARRLGLGSHTLLLQRLPTDAALARARDAIVRLNRATQALTDAETRQARAQTEHDAFKAEDGPHQAVLDVEHIRQRFDALGDIPAQADRYRRDTAALRNETEGLESAVAAIDPAPGALDRLRALPLPDAATIAKFVHATEVGESEIKRLGDGLAATDESLASIDAELARLRGGGAVPSRGDLLGARQRRDSQLDALSAVIDGDAAARKLRLAEVWQSSKAIDGITDLLLTDTERATRYEDALQRLATHRATRERDAAKLQGLQARLAELTITWANSWTAAGLTPHSPAEMALWRGKIEDILNKLGKLDGHKVNLDALAAGLESGKAALIAFLGSVGRTPDATLAPEILFREAKSRVDELLAAWADARARAVKAQRVERDLSEAITAVATAQAGLTEQRAIWPASMDGIGLAESVTAAEAEAALAVWQSVALPKASRESESHRVETIDADLAAFDADVFDIVDRVAPRLKDASAQESLARLLTALAEARTASEACKRLRHNAAQRAAKRQLLTMQRQTAGATLIDACRIFGVEADALPAAIVRTVARHVLEGDRIAVQRDLQESEGHDEGALRAEREGLDLDLLPGDIAREEVRQNQLIKDIAEATAIARDKMKELDALLKGRNAPAAATERAEAGAELLSIAERWLLRAAASKLASRTIELHRAKVQDPLIARASTLFAMATDAAFGGLAIAYGDDDQPVLVAQRRDGEQVKVAGLSEGTRDQLFLALRLALLERHTSEPLPFIGDDLLASFDEARTLAMLRLLAAAGAQRQVILFTHHRHVAELARSIEHHPVDIIEL